MRILPTFQNEAARPRGAAQGRVPMVLLSVVAALVAIVVVAIPLLSEGGDPEVRTTLHYIGASQQLTTSGIKAINDSIGAERRDLKMVSDQVFALVARLSMLQEDMTLIQRNNEGLAERVKAIQTQMTQDNVSAAEQLKTLTQAARDNAGVAEQLNEQLKESHEQMAGVLAKVSEEGLRLQTPLPQPRPTHAISKRRPIAPSQAKL